MAAITGLPPVHLQEQRLEVRPLDTRVDNATQSIFQRFKQETGRVWGFTVTAFSNVFDQVGIVFFSVLGLIHPALGPKIENIYLRVCNVFQSIRESWRQEETQRELEQLRNQVQILTVSRAQIVRNSAAVEQNSAALEQNVLHVQRQNALIAQSEAAVVARLAHSETQNGQLKQKNDELTLQHAALGVLLNQVIGQKDALQAKVSQLEQEALDGHDRFQSDKALLQTLDHLKKLSGQPSSPERQTEIDDDLENLHPQLVERFQKAKVRLDAAMAKLPATSLARTSLQSFDGAITDATALFARIPETLKRHSRWNSEISTLLTEV